MALQQWLETEQSFQSALEWGGHQLLDWGGHQLLFNATRAKGAGRGEYQPGLQCCNTQYY